MTMSATHAAERAGPMRGLLPVWVGAGIYAVFVLAGNHLLIDPDTMWQITIGQWIVDHGTVPHTDAYSFTMRGQPWISTQWLAQVAYAAAYAAAGWTGPVVLASACIATTFALFTRFLAKRLNESTTLVFIATALALTVPHLLARPHVLALPVMTAWVGGLVQAADRRAAPSFWLLPLIALWANLHGGFVLGLALVAPIAADAVWNADARMRKPLALRWAAFAAASLAASCLTPYGWNSLLASRKILALGEALPLIMEWRPADFSAVGPLEICLLLGLALALYRGITLPPLRIVLLLGLLHIALSQMRSLEIFALLVPLFLAAPLAKQIGAAEDAKATISPPHGALIAGLAVTLLAGTMACASMIRFEPHMRGSPVAAVAELKKLNFSRVFNDYDFGGYLIASGVAPFIDGRTELYGEKFFVAHNSASGLMKPENLFRLLDDYRIEATLMRTQSAATKLLDHIDGWQKIYADELATIHIRKPGAAHTAEPAVDPSAY
ncbi:hypothetical protein [uncultured Bradyrhizobium sp.]|uniref:hypothetical protein n=1 Tax=uncultured Bradyrhizobium sp. TaxID=199684 RepID=UPI0035C989E9